MPQNLFVVPQNRSPVEVYPRDYIDSLGLVSSTGITGNGLTDDTSAIQAAINNLQDGQTLNLPGRCYMSVAVAGGSGVVINKKNNITIRGTIVNNEFGSNSTLWKTITSITSVGQLVTVITAAPHGKGSGAFVNIYCDAPIQYRGIYQITVIDEVTFTYLVPALDPAPYPAATGVMVWSIPDFTRNFFKFTGCSNVKLDLTFVCPTSYRSTRHRFGYQGLLFDLADDGTPNSEFDIRLNCQGLAYVLQAGSFQTSKIGSLIDSKFDIKANNVGYGAAFYNAGWNSFVKSHIEDCHRVLYCDAPRDLIVVAAGKNWDNSGCIYGTHYVPSTGIHYGYKNLKSYFTDLATDEDTSYVHNSGSACNALLAQDFPAPFSLDEVLLHTTLITTDTIGRNRRGNYCFFPASCVGSIDKLTFSGLINRLGVSTMAGVTTSDELFFRTPAGSLVKNVSIKDFVVLNSATSAGQSLFRRDINLPTCDPNGRFIYQNTRTDSFLAVTITGVTPIDLDLVPAVTVEGATTYYHYSTTFLGFASTDGTAAGVNKTVRFGVPDYAGNFTCLFIFSGLVASNEVVWGGGTGKALTQQSWSIDSVVDVGAGTQRMRLVAGGLLIQPSGISHSLNAAVALDVDSQTKGFKAPTGTKVQRNAIAVPPEGLLFRVTDGPNPGLQEYRGGAWGVLGWTADP